MIDVQAVTMSALDDAARVEALAVPSTFRTEFYRCLTVRGDALFEVTDALLCTDGPVGSLVDLVLASERRRGHGGTYDGLSSGHIDVGRLRRAVAVLPVLRAAGGRIVLAVDVSPRVPDPLVAAAQGADEGVAGVVVVDQGGGHGDDEELGHGGGSVDGVGVDHDAVAAWEGAGIDGDLPDR